MKMTPHLSLKEEGRHHTDSDTDKHIGNGGNGIAVSLPPNNHEHSMRDVTIARLIFGKRHCRVLTVGNINFDATGFDIACGKTCGKIALRLWKTLLDRSK